MRRLTPLGCRAPRARLPSTSMTRPPPGPVEGRGAGGELGAGHAVQHLGVDLLQDPGNVDSQGTRELIPRTVRSISGSPAHAQIAAYERAPVRVAATAIATTEATSCRRPRRIRGSGRVVNASSRPLGADRICSATSSGQVYQDGTAKIQMRARRGVRDSERASDTPQITSTAGPLRLLHPHRRVDPAPRRTTDSAGALAPPPRRPTTLNRPGGSHRTNPGVSVEPFAEVG